VTPLFSACEKGFADVVRLLVGHGADVHQKVSATPRNWWRLLLLCGGAYTHVFVLCGVDSYAALCMCGLQVLGPGFSPLSAARANGHHALLPILLANQADSGGGGGCICF
jgi:ankyrin repeat protein